MIASQPESGPLPFGKYLLDREIARGGMARVHLARLRGLGGFEKRLVVKQILPALASDPRFVEMFVEEAKTLVQMSHPHVVPVYELGVVDGVYFLAMEYVEGATLAEVLDDCPLEPAESAHVGVQICDALSYAHEKFSIVHRDVTPRNVMIDGAGHCRLLDFGIAAPVTDEIGGQLFGTPGYLSPEQARGESIAASSDLFSLGAVLWHALAGAPPEATRTIESARALAPGAPRPTLEAVDRELAAIIERALDPDPAARFADARSMGRALRAWLAARHPEGVAPELGARAERARARREVHRANDPAPSSDAGTAKIARTPATPAKVQTLAVSRALEELTSRTAPLVGNSTAPPTPPAPSPQEGRGTVPLPGRTGRPAVPRPPRSRGPLALAIAAVLALVAIAITSARQPALEPLPIAAAPPREVPGSVPTVLRDRDPGPDPAQARGPEVVPEPPTPSTALGTDRTTEPAPQTARRATAEPARRATLAVTTTRAWATIELDGRTLGTTPVRRLSITPGAHTIVARSDVLGREARTRFEVGPGGSVHAVVDLDTATISVRERGL